MSESDDVKQLFDDNGVTNGYTCVKLLENNSVNKVDLLFYIDVAYPRNKGNDALKHLSSSLLTAVASRYGVSSGVRCSDPPLDGSSWLVQVTSDAKDYTRVTLFGRL